MNKLLFIFLTGTLISFGQTLSVGPNSSININSNSSLSVDGLELAPNEAYTISGPNTLDRSNVPGIICAQGGINPLRLFFPIAFCSLVIEPI